MERYFEDSVPSSSEDRFMNPWDNVPKKDGSDVRGLSHGSFSAFASDTSLFSSSLPLLSQEKLNVADSDHSHQSSDDGFSFYNRPSEKNKDPLKGIEPDITGNLLPDDENELLGGIMDDFDLGGLPNKVEDLEDDFFVSGGGMELDAYPHPQEALTIGMSKASIADGFAANGVVHYGLPNSVAAVVGEHPYGEHPSRTLFVRNINSNVEDSELKSVFEEYGDIRTLYTACRHRGFVMVSYYDIRSARTAMRSLQNKPLRRRKLDIHFSIPKDNPSEKDVNQGTLVVFNLDASVSNDDLLQIFGAYGEVKEIRETPHKRHHKFIEFYDVRAADAALKALNRCDIAGKRIKLEPSRPGGARRNLMQQLNQELEQDEARIFRHQIGSPVTNSPPGNWGQMGSPVEQNLLRALGHSQSLGTFGPINSSHLPGLASILPNRIPNSSKISPKISPIGKCQGGMDHLSTSANSSDKPVYQHSHSLPDQKFSASSGESNSNSSGIATLSGPEFLWGSPTLYSENTSSSAWSTSSSGQPFVSNGQRQSLPYLSLPYHHHHVGSAPSFMNPVGFGGIDPSHNNGTYMMNRGALGPMSPSFEVPRTKTENSSPDLRMMSLPMRGSIYFGNVSFPGLAATSDSQTESKKQYQLDLENIIRGEDTRTTLMIKNIPNKYTSMMLLAEIDENHKGTYDFLYFPIDFKNKCNVGYAFINMVSPAHIPSFYKEFNGKKWEKFNSEKVASLAYGRIQGKAALVTHFHNSSLMNEDRRCMPILFNVDGQLTTDQELYPSSNLNICVRRPDGSYCDNRLDSPNGILDEKT